MTMIMKVSPAVKAILKVLMTKTTTGLKLRVRKRRMRMKTMKMMKMKGTRMMMTVSFPPFILNFRFLPFYVLTKKGSPILNFTNFRLGDEDDDECKI